MQTNLSLVAILCWCVQSVVWRDYNCRRGSKDECLDFGACHGVCSSKDQLCTTFNYPHEIGPAQLERGDKDIEGWDEGN